LYVAEKCPALSLMDITWGSFEGQETTPVVTGYDVCSQGLAAGNNRFALLGPFALDIVSNQLFLKFHADVGKAVVSTIELSKTPNKPLIVVGADASRNTQSLVARYSGGAYEAVLGRL